MTVHIESAVLGNHYSQIDGKPAVPMTDAGKKTRDLVISKMRDGVYTLEQSPCICKTPEPSDVTLATVDRYRIPHRTVLCMQCGLVRTDPRMTQDAYNDFYRHYYRTLYERPGQSREQLFMAQQNNAERRYNYIRSHVELATDAEIVEFGCGAGWNLCPFQQAQFTVSGYDFDDDYLKIGNEQGLDLQYGSIQTAVDAERQYDVIILSHVVEHFLDPLDELAALSALLKPDGILYVEVPSILAVKINPLKYFQNAHTYSFAPQTLCSVMERAGYSEIASSPQIESLWRFNGKPTSYHSSSAMFHLILQHLKRAERYRVVRDPLYNFLGRLRA